MRKESITRRVIRRLCTLRPTALLFFAWLFLYPLLAPESSPALQREPDVAPWGSGHSMEPTTTPVSPLLAQRHQSDRFRNRYEQWQNMNPDEKETLRRRMDKWNQMAPQERERYQHRFDQWKGLSPEEQRQIDQKLENWKGLSPAEKEDVRKRFR